MARYRVLERSFINNHIVEEGAVIDYDPGDGEVAGNLELVRGKRGSTPPDPADEGDPTDPA